MKQQNKIDLSKQTLGALLGLSAILLGFCFPLQEAIGAHNRPFGKYDASLTFETGTTGGNCSSCQWISAIGVFDDTSAEKFKIFLAKERPSKGTYIVFHSPGGDLLSALQIGVLIKKNNLNTAIGLTAHHGEVDLYGNRGYHVIEQGECFSACAYAFLGGRTRKKSQPSGGGGQIGFHQFYEEAKNSEFSQNIDSLFKKNGYSIDQLLSGILLNYIIKVDASPKLLIRTSQISSKEMWIPEADELEELKILSPSGYSDWKLDVTETTLFMITTERDPTSSIQNIAFSCNFADRKLMFTLVFDLGRSVNSEIIDIFLNNGMEIEVGSISLKLNKSEIQSSIFEKGHLAIGFYPTRNFIELLISNGLLKVTINPASFLGFHHTEIHIRESDQAKFDIIMNSCGMKV